MSAPILERATVDPIVNPNDFAREHGLDIKLDSTLGTYRLVEFQLGPMRSLLVGDTRKPHGDISPMGFHDLIWVEETQAEAHRQAALESISDDLSGTELLDVQISNLPDILTYRS